MAAQRGVWLSERWQAVEFFPRFENLPARRCKRAIARNAAVASGRRFAPAKSCLRQASRLPAVAERKVSQSEQPFIRLCLTMKNVFGIVSPRHQIVPREEIYEEDRFRGSCSGCRRLCSASCDRAGWWLSPPSSPSPPPSSLLTKWPLNRGHFFVVLHRPAINWQMASCQYVT
jgi:hypothetical protein